MDGLVGSQGLDVAGFDRLVLDGFEWQVPGLLLSVPGLLVVIAVLAQLAGGLVWLPVIRRRLETVRDLYRRAV
jgi:hypothetical protein